MGEGWPSAHNRAMWGLCNLQMNILCGFSEGLVLSWQARFLRSNIFSPSEPDMGTAGILKVEVISAKNLRNADIIGASDPYVVVRVGLQSAETNVIEDGTTCTEGLQRSAAQCTV